MEAQADVRRLALAIGVVALLVAPPTAAQLAADGSPRLHGEHDVHAGPLAAGTQLPVTTNIHIQGDAELADHSAVRSGDGTQGNPYVISNWTVVNPHGGGTVELRDTRAHVVIRDLWLPAPDRAGGVVVSNGLLLQNVSNVDVVNVLVRQASVGLDIQDSTHVTVDRVQIGGQLSEKYTATDTGLHVLDSEHIDIGNLTVRSSDIEARIDESQHVRVHDSTFHPSGIGTVYVDESRFVQFDHVDFPGVGIELDGLVTDLVVARNVFDGKVPSQTVEAIGPAGYSDGIAADDFVKRIELCGNIFRWFKDNGLWLEPVEKITIRGNLFENSGTNLNLESVLYGGAKNAEIHLTRNIVRDSPHDGLKLELGPSEFGAEVHHNIFENNTDGERLSNVNASDNWWGHPDGPAPFSNGAGERLFRDNATIQPVLDEPPAAGPDAVDCGLADRSVGAKLRPDLSFEASATAGVEAMVSEQLGPAHLTASLHPRTRAHAGPLDIPAELGPPFTRDGGAG